MYTLSSQIMENLSYSLEKYFSFLNDLVIRHPFIPTEFIQLALKRQFKDLTDPELKRIVSLWENHEEILSHNGEYPRQ